MQLQYHPHRLALDETAPDVRAALWQLRRVLVDMPYLYWPEKSDKLQGDEKLSAQKERQLRKQESLQSLYNMWLRLELEALGFEAECPVRNTRPSANPQRVDFAKLLSDGSRLFIEVEFGNTASIERNLLKLADAHHHGRSALGVMICPSAALARATASGVASFETACERLQAFHPDTLPVPLLLLGLDHTDERRIDLSQSRLPDPSCLSGNKSKVVLAHVARQLLAGVAVEEIALPDGLGQRVARRRLKARSVARDGQGCLWS